MAIVWNRPSTRFSFGNLAPHQTQLYEDNPNLAMQHLMDWYGQGNSNFAYSKLGNFIASQQDRITNDETIAQAQQVARNNTAQQAWQLGEDQRRSAWDTQQQAGLNNYNQQLLNAQERLRKAMAVPGMDNYAEKLAAQSAVGQLQANPYKVQQYQGGTFVGEKPLVLTDFMEANAGKYGNLVDQFNQLSANQRGANPGIFQVRRQIW